MLDHPGVWPVSDPALENSSKESLQVLSESDGDDGKVSAEGEDWKQGKVVAQHGENLFCNCLIRHEWFEEIESVDV